MPKVHFPPACDYVSFRFFCKNNQYYDYYATVPTFAISKDTIHKFNVSPPPDYALLKREGSLVIRDRNSQALYLGHLDFTSLCASHADVDDVVVNLDLKSTFEMDAFLSYDGKCEFGTWTEGENNYVTGRAVGDIMQVLLIKSGSRTYRFENN